MVLGYGWISILYHIAYNLIIANLVSDTKDSNELFWDLYTTVHILGAVKETFNMLAQWNFAFRYWLVSSIMIDKKLYSKD